MRAPTIPRLPLLSLVTHGRGRACSRRWTGWAGALALLLLPLAGASNAQPAVAVDGRVIVLGFDGADARTVQRLMDQGRLPNLKRLADGGTFAPLRSTNPAESAAGWAALNTGTNPLKNQVPGFLKRSADGRVAATPAHVEWGPAAVEDLAPDGLLGVYVRHPAWRIAVVVGLGALIVLFALLRFALRARPLVAGGVAVVLGGAGAWAATLPAKHVFQSVPNVYRNKVSQRAFWDYAAEAGKEALVLDAALAFGRPETPGARVLAGLGVPDVNGAMNGTWSLYTTDEMQLSRPPSGSVTRSQTGTIYRVDETNGRIDTKVYGPVNFTELSPVVDELASIAERLEQDPARGQRLQARKLELEQRRNAFMQEPWKHRAQLDLALERRGDKLAITIGDTTHEVGEGQWTGWFRLPFRLNPLVTANAITRARVMSWTDPLTVYFNTFDIDPEHPPFWQPVSSPSGFSRQLAQWTGGPFETLGWSCMTNQMKDKSLPVDVFLEDIEFTMRWRERLTYACLERDDWELLFSVFSTTDRVQHVMYRYFDEGHPGHEPGEASREVEFFGAPRPLRDVIPAIYEQMDRIVGEVLSRLEPEDHLFLCADHGFNSYRYGLQVNNWLAKEGYLAFRRPTGQPGRVGIAQAADWSRTRAYSLGLGMVYVNMSGREPQGIVPRSAAKALLKEIGDKLLELEDVRPGQPTRRPVLDYEIMDDVYAGGDLRWGDAAWPCADMMIGLSEYYRSSWESVYGEMRFAAGPRGRPVVGPSFRDNSSNWSGDHASNSPDLVTGIFFSRRPVELPAGGISVLHVAPTLLEALGVRVPEHMDERPLATR